MDNEEWNSFRRLLSEAGEGIGTFPAWEALYRAASSVSLPVVPAGSLRMRAALRVALNEAKSDAQVPGRFLWADGTCTDGAEATLRHAASKLGFVEEDSVAGNEGVSGAATVPAGTSRTRKSRRTRPSSDNPTQRRAKVPKKAALDAGHRNEDDTDQPTFTHMEGLRPGLPGQDGAPGRPNSVENTEVPLVRGEEGGGADGNLALVAIATQLRQLIQDAANLQTDVAKAIRAQEVRHTALAEAHGAQLARLEEELRHQNALGDARHAAIVALLEKDLEAVKRAQAMVLQALATLPPALVPTGHDGPPASYEDPRAPVETLEDVIERLGAQMHAAAGATAAPGDGGSRVVLGSINDRITVMMGAVAELGQQHAVTARIQASHMSTLVEDLHRRLAVTLAQLAGIVQTSLTTTSRFLADHGDRLVRLEEPPLARGSSAGGLRDARSLPLPGHGNNLAQADEVHALKITEAQPNPHMFVNPPAAGQPSSSATGEKGNQ